MFNSLLAKNNSDTTISVTGTARGRCRCPEPIATGIPVRLGADQQSILNRPVLYLSEYFKRNRAVYFDSLHAYHESDAILDWLKFFFEGVAEVAEEAIEICKKITEIRERDMRRVSLMGKAAPNGEVALRRLFRGPIVSVRHIEEATRLSRTNANRLVAKFVDAQILVQSDSTVEYGRTFIYQDYLRAFSEKESSE